LGVSHSLQAKAGSHTREEVASAFSRKATAVAHSEIFGPLAPTGTGCVHATYPFDSRILART
jgi:hypothetical protein